MERIVVRTILLLGAASVLTAPFWFLSLFSL